MPDKIIQLPGGQVVAFPDSMSDDAISAVLRKQVPSLPPLPKGYSLEQLPPLPQGYTLDFSDALVPKADALDFSDALVPKVTSPPPLPASVTGAIANPKPGTSIHWQNPPGTRAERKQATDQVLAGSAPAVGSAVGDLAGPSGAAAGAFVGTMAEPLFVGGKPDMGKAVENAAIYGGTSYGLGLLGDAASKISSWFGLGAKTAPEEWQAINDALGVSRTQIKGPLGATSPDDMWGIPGRSVLSRVGVTGKELSKMTPFEQAQRIAPAWKSAGAEIDAIADTATKNGVKFDVGKSVTQAVQNIDSPQVQDRALRVLSDTAKQLGIQDWRAATPTEALALRRALWENLGNTQWGKPLYGAVTRDLKSAVPQLAPADQAFSELQGAMQAIKRGQQAAISKAPVSPAAQAWQSLPKPVRYALPFVAGAAGGGALVRGAAKLSDMLAP